MRRFFKKVIEDLLPRRKTVLVWDFFLARKLAQQIGGDLKLLENYSIDSIDELKSLKKKNIFYLELPIKELNV